MSAAPPPPPLPPFLQTGKVDVRPSFTGALRGVWLLTWKSQMTFRRIPLRLLLLLLALPFLVWITVQSPDQWNRRHVPLVHVNPPLLNRFFRRLHDLQPPATPQQEAQLSQIFAEEYATAGQELHEAQSIQDTDLRGNREREIAAACEERILSRGREILDDPQFDRLKNFESDNRQRMEMTASNHPTTWGRSEPFYHWLVDVYFFIVLPLGCVRGCGALIRDELQADTLGFLVTRPANRARILIVKYISQLAWLQMLLLIETLLIFAAGYGRHILDLEKLLPLFLAAQFLAAPAWTALGTLLGQLTSRYMAAALVYGAIVEMGIGRIPTNINVLSVMRHLKTVLSHNGALDTIYGWPTDDTGLSIAALCVAPVLFMAVAAALFSYLEYLPASEMQK